MGNSLTFNEKLTVHRRALDKEKMRLTIDMKQATRVAREAWANLVRAESHGDQSMSLHYATEASEALHSMENMHANICRVRRAAATLTNVRTDAELARVHTAVSTDLAEHNAANEVDEHVVAMNELRDNLALLAFKTASSDAVMNDQTTAIHQSTTAAVSAAIAARPEDVNSPAALLARVREQAALEMDAELLSVRAIESSGPVSMQLTSLASMREALNKQD